MENKERMKEIFEHISDFPVEEFKFAINKWGEDMRKLNMKTSDRLSQNLRKIVEDAKRKGAIK